MAHQRRNSLRFPVDRSPLPSPALAVFPDISPPPMFPSPPSSAQQLPIPHGPSSPQSALSLALSAILAAVHPRKTRQRSTVLALALLAALSLYVFYAASPNLSLAPMRLRPSPLAHHGADAPATHHAEEQPASRLFRYPGLRQKAKQLSAHRPTRPQVQLTPAQELAAVSGFLASRLAQNSIPAYVDPAKPLDPELVLDFDTRAPRAEQEVKNMVEDVWSTNPVILYSKMHSPVAREMKTIINSLSLAPYPVIFEVDARDDAAVLTPLLFRLTGATKLPILLIGGEPVSLAALREAHASGALTKMVVNAGAVVDGSKKRKGRH